MICIYYICLIALVLWYMSPLNMYIHFRLFWTIWLYVNILHLRILRWLLYIVIVAIYFDHFVRSFGTCKSLFTLSTVMIFYLVLWFETRLKILYNAIILVFFAISSFFLVFVHYFCLCFWVVQNKHTLYWSVSWSTSIIINKLHGLKCL